MTAMISTMLLIAIGIIIGAVIVLFFYQRNGDGRDKRSLPKNYLQGLNFLLNEEPDKAVDLFIKLLDVDSETVETHLALGNLFRRRGEVNRAIRIHQNLIARPSLSANDRGEAMLALAIDYLSAGVLDRAEKLFNKLIELNTHLDLSLRHLLDIYQQEKSWQQAIDVAQRLSSVSGQQMNVSIAHYYCELAEIDMENGSVDQAYRYLKRALMFNRECARASLLLGELECVSGRHKHAIRLYRQIVDQNPDFISETIMPLAEVYQALGDEESFEQYMRSILRMYPKMPFILLLVEKFKNWQQDSSIVSLLMDYVKAHPSVPGLNYLIQLQLASTRGHGYEHGREQLLLLQQLTKTMQANYSYYQCEVCGFASKTILWLCPSCKSWESIKSAYLLKEK